MPLFNIKTVSAETVWKSPDGQRTIYKVLMDYNGQKMQAKTYSQAITQPGWTGEVESYEKAGRNGMETFVRQAPKQDGFQTRSQKGSEPGKPMDSYTMYLAYVKDVAVALINAKAYTTERLNDIATDVATTGEMFYGMRPDAKKEEPVKQELDTVFNDVETLDNTEDPWNPTNNVPTLPV